MFYLFIFITALISTAILTLIVKKIAVRFKVMDVPTERKIHQRPIPLLGGAAIFIVYFGLLFLFAGHFLSGNLHLSHLVGFFIGALIIIIGGVLDDKYNLKPQQQIIFPLLAIAAVIFGGVEIAKITNPFGGVLNLESLFFISPLFIALWLLGMMYTTKLLDGVDGLVSGVSAIGGLIIFLFTLTSRYYQPDIAFAAALLVGTCLGFLIFNWHPAKIFLGEGGSLLLGYILGVLAIISGGKIAIALLVMGVPILDVAWTIIRRLLKGKNPLKFSDRGHLHYRLLSLGIGQRKTVLVFYFLSLLFGVSGLFLQSRGKFWALAALLLVMLLLVTGFGLLDRRKKNVASLSPASPLPKRQKLLLHICCAPCGTYISRDRLAPYYDLTWYFYNSNLNSREEYEKRLHYVKLMAEKFSWPLIIEPYNHETWQKKIGGHEADPEKGGRCQICYFDRLEKTAKLAKQKGFDFFSTTLLVSPYKDTEMIKDLSGALTATYGVNFLNQDFQADNGYHHSQELAKELEIYRQKFCGCEYSLKPQAAPVYPPANGKIKKSRPSLKRLGVLLFILVLPSFISHQAAAQTETLSLEVVAGETSASTTLDLDNDGYTNEQEIENNYSPYNPGAVKIDKSDMDKDGLSDYWELKFKTDPLNSDTDSDGYTDGKEIDMAYNPLSSLTGKLPIKIGIDLKKQELTYFVANEPWKIFTVSTGKASMPTPKGTFYIANKSSKAWSKTYKLWMPYWLGLGKSQVGIHELPLWPNGYREGEDHLGKPVSHGCIRLGIGPAKYLYDRVGTGTEVIIK